MELLKLYVALFQRSMATAVTPTALLFNNAALSVGENTIYAGVAGKSIYVTQFTVNSTVPVIIQSSDHSVQVCVAGAGLTGGTSTAILPTGLSLVATTTSAGTASGFVMGFVH